MPSSSRRNAQAYVADGLKPALAALRANDMMEARIVIEKLRTLHDAANKTLDALVQLQVDEAKKEYEAATALYGSIRILAIASMAIGLALAAVLGWLGWCAASRASWAPNPARCWP